MLGRWASGDTDIRRTSVDGQDDANATVDVDMLETKPGVTLRSYRLRVNLYRAVGRHERPAIVRIGAMTSATPDRFDGSTSKPGKAAGIELPVPGYAQNIHKGQFPEYGGGGENPSSRASWTAPATGLPVTSWWSSGSRRMVP